jgi:excisionase family DNA binding protein
MTGDELDLLTIPQLAEHWQVSKRLIAKLVATGEIPSVLVARHRRIRAVDAARWVAENTRTERNGHTS